MKKNILFLLIVGFLATAFGFYQYNRPLENVQNIQADFKTDASQLFTEFEEDEASANVKYLDKIIEVSGKIIGISQQEDGTQSITLESDNMIFGVIGELAQKNPTQKVSKGDQITIKGVCSGMLSDVVLVRCIIL